MPNSSVHLFLHHFASLLKTYRLEKGLTQRELCDRIGVSLRTYQRIENNQAEPTLFQVYRLSHELGFKFEEIFHFQRDISDEQRILLQSVKLLEQINEVSLIGGWELDLSTQKLYWTEMTKDIHEVEDDYNPSVDEAISFYKEGPSRQSIMKAVQECIEHGTEYELELILTTAKKKEILILTRGKAERVNGRSLRIFGTFQDISSLKNAEARLTKSLEKINEVKHLAKMGIWELDLTKNELHWSDTLYSIFEVDKNTFTCSYERFLELVHPEDREKVHIAYQKSLETKAPYEIIHRLLLPDGRIKWILESCKSTFNDEGKPLHSIGYSLDITRLKDL